MRRFLQVRILFVLIALLLVPALVLPFAERLRAEWARYWEPKAEAERAVDEGEWCGTSGGVGATDVCEIPVENLVAAEEFPSSEEIAERELLLRLTEEIELSDLPFPDEPPLMYPDEELGYPFGNWREQLRERAGEQVSNANP